MNVDCHSWIAIEKGHLKSDSKYQIPSLTIFVLLLNRVFVHLFSKASKIATSMECYKKKRLTNPQGATKVLRHFAASSKHFPSHSFSNNVDFSHR